MKLLRETCEAFFLIKPDRPREGEHVTCTQLVVRAYSRAELSIRILPSGGDRFDVRAFAGAVGELVASKEIETPLAAEEREEWLRMQSSLREKCLELSGEAMPPTEGLIPKGPLRGWDGVTSVRAEGQWRSNLVTPRNLEESEDLRLVGRVYPPGEFHQAGTTAR